MSLAKALRPKPIARIKGAAQAENVDDLLAVEEPLEIRVGGRSIAVVMRTPGHDRELAAGFLATEGVVRRRDDLLDIVRCHASRENGGAVSENILNVLLAAGASAEVASLTRHVFTSSSCGICSKASIAALEMHFPPICAPLVPSRAVLRALPDRLRAAQAGFAASGGLHACALFSATGELEIVREDVGRHNALDKIIGHAFLADTLPLAGRILLLSGRVSFEMVQKARAAGIGCIAAISAPTTAAVELARAGGQTLVGFLRDERMNVYGGTLAD